MCNNWKASKVQVFVFFKYLYSNVFYLNIKMQNQRNLPIRCGIRQCPMHRVVDNRG